MITRNLEVGKYVVSDTIMTYGFSGSEYGVITKISGKRIYFKNMNGVENFIMNFSAVCDTLEECVMLREFSRDCVREINEVNKKREEEFKSFFNR